MIEQLPVPGVADSPAQVHIGAAEKKHAKGYLYHCRQQHIFPDPGVYTGGYKWSLLHSRRRDTAGSVDV
jgi:hypothetical protein